MPSAHARERALAWTLIGATTLVAVVASADAWRRVGSITPGFNLMANLQIGVGDRGGVELFGQIRAVDGQPVRSHAELRALVEARPVGTVLRYAIERDGRSEERAVPSRQVTLRDLKHFLIDSLLPGLLTLMIAAAVTVLRPDAAEGRLFQGFCLISSLVQVVERCFGAFLDEILERGGDVNETAGDGLMVIFKDPDPARHARAAVLTALGILRRPREISAEPGMPATVALRLGVNSGPAAVGATKIQGRAGARWTYTASGSVTNVAARLASLGMADTVLFGPETRRRLDDGFRPRDLGEHQLKNVDVPVRVFGLGHEESSPPSALRLA